MKKGLKYISHFFYVAFNWNIWMAIFMVYDNIRGSKKYGEGTFLPEDLGNLTITRGNKKEASRYEAVSFYMLEKLFTAFRRVSAEDSIVDLGCGKGRMMMVAPHFGFKKLTGIDFASELCELARQNMEGVEKKFPGISWQVLNENVEDYRIEPDDSVFFMFNPFTDVVLKNFLDRLDRSCQDFPRKLFFLYASPQSQELLLNRGFAIIYRKKKMYLESLIAVRDDFTGQ